ncbi:sugar phosphate isomerase/epimerase [bacterium]|nr:sugar phosphate isomerase/epimerase [bacterium]
MDIGISTIVDLDVPLTKLVGQVAEAGFTHLSLSHDIGHGCYHLPEGRKELVKLLAGSGIKLNYIHAPLEDYHDVCSLDPQVRRLTIETYKLGIIACAEIGGLSVVAHAANIHPVREEDIEPRIAASIESLHTLSDFAVEQGVVFCIENLPCDRDYGMLSLRIIEEADWPGLRLCIDPCHAQIGVDDPMALMRSMAPRVHTTHFSDTMGSDDSHPIPGEGRVDFGAVARLLGEAGFDGVLDLECSLWMLRRRDAIRQHHPGDPVPSSTEAYLARAAAAARRIGDQIDQARTEHFKAEGSRA